MQKKKTRKCSRLKIIAKPNLIAHDLLIHTFLILDDTHVGLKISK